MPRTFRPQVFVLIRAPEVDSGALSVSEMDSPRAPDTRGEWSLGWAPAGAAGRCKLVSCPQQVVLGLPGWLVVIGSISLLSQGFERQPAY